jgi:hypothetical protein
MQQHRLAPSVKAELCALVEIEPDMTYNTSSPACGDQCSFDPRASVARSICSEKSGGAKRELRHGPTGCTPGNP